MTDYNPRAHFWIVGGDEAMIFSSASRAYVAATPEALATATRITSEAELWQVLRAAAPECPPATALNADDVRAEARRRIIAIYPEWQQLNMSLRGIELVRIGEACWTPEEAEEAAALQDAWDWIKAVRAASNVMEAEPPADYADDARWPER